MWLHGTWILIKELVFLPQIHAPLSSSKKKTFQPRLLIVSPILLCGRTYSVAFREAAAKPCWVHFSFKSQNSLFLKWNQIGSLSNAVARNVDSDRRTNFLTANSRPSLRVLVFYRFANLMVNKHRFHFVSWLPTSIMSILERKPSKTALMVILNQIESYDYGCITWIEFRPEDGGSHKNAAIARYRREKVIPKVKRLFPVLERAEHVALAVDVGGAQQFQSVDLLLAADRFQVVDDVLDDVCVAGDGRSQQRRHA